MATWRASWEQKCAGNIMLAVVVQDMPDAPLCALEPEVVQVPIGPMPHVLFLKLSTWRIVLLMLKHPRDQLLVLKLDVFRKIRPNRSSV